MNHLLIDGDVLVYRFAHADQFVTKWNNSLHTTHAEFVPARSKMDEYIGELMGRLDAEACTIVLSDVDNSFRQGVYEDYKNNRAGVSRPILFKPLRDHLLANWEAVQEFRLEGDDLLGLYSVGPNDRSYVVGEDEAVICTIDKDLDTVPGLRFNIGHPDAEVYEVTDVQADYNFLFQTLTGDSTDGYPGCPGVGPVKAKRILEEMLKAKDPLEYGWNRVVETYREKGLEGMALINARCARILRGDEYDFETKEVKLWEPPTD